MSGESGEGIIGAVRKPTEVADLAGVHGERETVVTAVGDAIAPTEP